MPDLRIGDDARSEKGAVDTPMHGMPVGLRSKLVQPETGYPQSLESESWRSEGGREMSLIEHNLFGKIDKVQQAIDRFKAFEPEDGYYLAFSGGKDSVVIKRLAEMANVKFDAHYNITSVDPPELVKFIKRHA